MSVSLNEVDYGRSKRSSNYGKSVGYIDYETVYTGTLLHPNSIMMYQCTSYSFWKSRDLGVLGIRTLYQGLRTAFPYLGVTLLETWVLTSTSHEDGGLSVTFLAPWPLSVSFIR